MHDNQVYSLTPRGQDELRGGETKLNPAEIELLVRIDGSQTLAQLRAGMTAGTGGIFTAALMTLQDKGLVMLAEVDPFTEQFSARMNDFAVTQAQSEADSGAASLKKAGYYVLLRLRQHPALKNVPVIMLTGKATREAVLKGLAGGADGYVTKPFEADALMHVVRTVLGLADESAALPSM